MKLLRLCQVRLGGRYMSSRRFKRFLRYVKYVLPKVERVYFKVIFITGASLASILLIGELTGVLRRIFPVFPFYQVLMMSVMLMIYGIMVGNGWPFRRTRMVSRKGYTILVCPTCKSKNQVLIGKLDSAICGRCQGKLQRSSS